MHRSGAPASLVGSVLKVEWLSPKRCPTRYASKRRKELYPGDISIDLSLKGYSAVNGCDRQVR